MKQGMWLTRVSGAAVLAAALAVASMAKADDTVIIGAAIAKSGVIAPYDEGPAGGMEIAVDEINAKGGLLGHPLKIVYADTKSDIAYGATAAQQVIDQGAKMVVVTCDYDYGSAAASVADGANLIAFSTCAGDPKFGPSGIGPNAFTMATGAPGQAVAMAEWAYKVKGWRKGYILKDTTIAFDATWAEFFKKRWDELAGKDGLLGSDTFGGDDPQIASQITRIKALPDKPDFIVLCSFPPGGVSAMRQIRAAGVDTPLLGSESWDGDFWLEGVPNLSEMYFVTYGSRFGQDPRPDVQAFMDKYVKKFGKPPVTSHAITGYSVIEAWSKAVQTSGGFDTDKVRDALQSFKDEKLLAGPTTFTKDQHINMQRDLLLIEVKDGKSGNVIQVVKAEQMPQ